MKRTLRTAAEVDHVYLFAHHHMMTDLWNKFLEDTERVSLLCEANVAPYYNKIAGDDVPIHLFKWRSTNHLLWLMLSGLALRLFRRHVDLYSGSLMGTQILYACALLRVRNVRYVIDHAHHNIRVVPPKTLRHKVLKAFYSCLIMRRVVLFEWGDVQEFGISEASDCHLSPPGARTISFPKWDHSSDLVILDFDLSGFPIDYDASIERIVSFVQSFRNPVVKPHPTHPGVMETLLGIRIIDRSIPAETLAGTNVHLLSLQSTAEGAFRTKTDVRDLLAFNSEVDRMRWCAPNGIVWKRNAWNLRKQSS